MLIRSLFCALHVYLFRMQPHLKIGNQMANLGKMVKESLMYMYKRMNHDAAFYTSLTARPHHMILPAAV